MADLPDGFRFLPDFLDRAAQEALVEDIRAVVAAAPLYVPAMPRTGKEMSVRMTNCGTLGWVTDKERGYRYQETHPKTGKHWPEMPARLRALWEVLADYPLPPEACLVNFYDDTAKMGMHQDSDEADMKAPVLSISLGDTCLFRVGGTERGGKAASLKLKSGDIVLLAGKSRLAFHGVTRTYPGTSTLLKNGGRINLTLRRVTAAP
ncbi:alpha-ketoglutarate-dependent dioxygenase AlkB family protein [Martelella limonii]|uniref:alpha-ketoglutarate-dependent dioxygenase AlkB family protein n=1 Tax=Martelella limonii TaxID=1647649 RepID=UPI001580E37E|nr:alpha-ketoglutarate-dependent dioxygenase AlkB [Martelella limonii]